MSEIWKPVKGNEDTHEVSNYGNLRSKSHNVLNRGSGYRYDIEGKPLKTTQAGNGYMVVNIKRSTLYVHRLVAEAFIGDIPAKMDINHKNGDRTDNRVDNLEIVTRRENISHSYKVLHRKGPSTPNARKAVRQIKDGKVINVYESARDAMRATGIHYKYISKSCHHHCKGGGYYWELETESANPL